ncbi:MAG: hypothetical protein Q4G05_06610 [Clostridia bacterium]|nr:hypothetical protein [Clostridia bacterium]
MSKIWKKLLLVIVIILCLFNVVKKIAYKNSLKEELKSSVEYIDKNGKGE